MSHAARAMQAARTGLFVNIILVIVKLLAGIAGHSYALIADAIESFTDIFSSLIVCGGLRITTKPADLEYPYGYGKAEALATAVVSLMLLGAAMGVAVAAVGEIMTPHHMPAPFTLAVIAAVIPVKEILYRRVLRVGSETGSTAVKADAWHHRSDAITSGAALIGIGVALWGGPGWESADAWAALLAAAVIALNGIFLLRPAIHDLMDRMPERPVLEQIAAIAGGVEGVRATEKLRVRKVGMEYFVDLHVQADEMLPLREAHILSGKVKGAIRSAVPDVAGVLIHMEPYEGKTRALGNSSL
ncbi:MAG: cation diffusion facilitator family transporter [Isosphaerales bacterium]